MAWIPEDAKWYLADVVLAISVEGSATTVVHINKHLIRADSPEEAFRKANALGRQSNTKYRNHDGERVSSRFLGLRDLLVVYDELEDGAEISYAERRTRSVEAARKLVAPKSKLGVFAPRRRPKPPNYVSAEIDRALEERFGRPLLPRRRAPSTTRRR